ncbi:MAG: portal protein, partial [Steroidobacteraceae bacterium]
MVDADETNRDAALDDIRFLHEPGHQWDEGMRKARGERPCYEFNELRVKALRVINDIRSNRPQGKVRAVEDGDKETADTREGLIRNIWAVSDGDSVTDYAADYQVSGGMGAWRVETVWNDDSAWEQDIRVRPFKNPFCLYADPAASDQLKLDADDWIITEKVSKASYEARWPDAELVQFDDDTHFDDDDNDWYGEEMVRVCEYWYKKPVRKVIALLSDGSTVEIKEAKRGDTRGATQADGTPLPTHTADGTPLVIKRRRTVNSHKIMSCIISGSSVLEQPTEWAGKYFPFVQVFGEWRVIAGKVVWHGLTRFSKDAQRLANVTMTAIAETVMTAPQSHYWATTKQAEGHLDKWKKAHKELIPFMPYNGDPEANGPPQRMGGADVPVALMEVRGIAADVMKGTTGIFDASVGAQSNETSGRAINARTRQGEVATFNYADNMAKGVRQTWIILDDLIGKIYPAEKSVRILGVDGAEKYVKVNSVQLDPKTGQMRKVNDLTKGKFDVTYTVGPSFSTQRQEATELYTQLGQALPAVWTVAGDLIFKSMDLPYAEQIAERMRTLLPPAIQKQIADGKQIPPEAQIAMAQVEQAMQQVQQLGQAAQQAMMEAQKQQSEAKSSSADAKAAAANIDVKIANLRAEEAKLAAQVAEFQKTVAENALALQQGADASLKAAVQEALLSIEEQAQNIFAQYGEQLQATHAEAVASVASTPRRRTVKLVRGADGGYEGTLADEVGPGPSANPPQSAPP